MLKTPWATAAGLLFVLALQMPASGTQDGQVIRDPDHPQWLKRHNGSPVFFCGPGDPEDFLYRGTRNPDGTRDGDQEELIGTLVKHGGNTIYMQAVRSHGGDGNPDHNPFVDSDPAKGLDEDILDQWERWFARMDENGILIYFFLYDDGAQPFGRGDRVEAPEGRFIQVLVNRFAHHRSLIWLVAEESNEALSGPRARGIAAKIKRYDDHDHLIGNHYNSRLDLTDWREGSALNHCSMQYTAETKDVHAAAVKARGMAERAGPGGDGYFVMYTESTASEGNDEADVREYIWNIAMAGVQPMRLRLDIADSTAGALGACGVLQRFMEGTDFQTMKNHDELAHAGTLYVLADPGRSHILYAREPAGDLGLKHMSAGAYDLRWVDCVSGETIAEENLVVGDGDRAFSRPADIGPWCAVWVTRDTATGATVGTDYFPPPESQGGWRKLVDPDDVRHLAGMDPEKLDGLAEWLKQSDQRDFAAVVIRNGYIALEVEHGNSAKTDARRVASVSKAVCATVLAIASERSRTGSMPRTMTFDDPAFDFIPWAQPLSDPRKAEIQVKQLLNHTSGICPEDTGAGNHGPWQRILGHTDDPLTANLAFDPGTACGYSTLALDHAALVCEDVTGKPYNEFAVEGLFSPLGCEHWWFKFHDSNDATGRHSGHSMGMPARGLARIAYCMLRDGRWGERQVIPRWFVAETGAPTHTVTTPEMRFKVPAQVFSHAWELPARLTGAADTPSGEGIPADARYKPGSGGQLIAFVPSLDLVITRQTGGSGDWPFAEYLRRACAAVIPAGPARGSEEAWLHRIGHGANAPPNVLSL